MNVPPAVNRRLSRSNSTTSSVATVKHLGAKIGHRKSSSTVRPPSSDSINRHFHTLDAAVETMAERGRSPNLNINRWSHSTSSSMGAVDSEFMRNVSGNAHASSSTMPHRDPQAKHPVMPMSQHTKQQSTILNPTQSPSRSPGRPTRIGSRRTSPDTARLPVHRQRSTDQIPALASTPEVDLGATTSNGTEYFGTTVLDHSRGSNKYGQQVEGIALQFTSGQPARQRRQDQSKLGNGLHQAANASHISLHKKPSRPRRKERAENGSNDTANGDSISSVRSDQSRRGGHRSPTQKNMLSQALSKANTAVLLDNDQDIHGAIAAYNEACAILEQVMTRSNDIEDRKKLSAIRATYSSRIAELYDLDNSFDYLNKDKELPQAPATTRYLDGEDRLSFEDLKGADAVRYLPEEEELHQAVQIPPRQESLLPQIYGGQDYMEEQPPPARKKPPPLDNLAVPMDSKYVPAPLSPRRPLSPAHAEDVQTPITALRLDSGTTNQASTGPTSWLDVAGDNLSSKDSSNRSSIDFLGKDRELMSAIEADLDAAVEAAYEDDYPPEPTPKIPDQIHPLATDQHQQPRAHHDEPHSLGMQPSQESVGSTTRYDYLTQTYLDQEAEEEEQLLEMMMADSYGVAQPHHQATISNPPRQSDSSGVSARSSGRTWESSATGVTQGTTLSTLAESPEIPQQQQPHVKTLADSDEDAIPNDDSTVLAQKQASPLPPLPPADKSSMVGLRDRRMSGQDAMQLKIETYMRRPPISQPGQAAQGTLLEIPSAHEKDQELSRKGSGTNISVASTLPLTPLASIHSADSTDFPAEANLARIISNSSVVEDGPGPAQTDVQRMPPPISKESSMNDMRPRNLSLATDNLNDLPATPGSALFPSHSRSGTVTTPSVSMMSPPLPLSSTTVGGMYIFDNIADATSLRIPRSAESIRAEPQPLEPCPDSFLLRPFWLMRCLYQSLSHPRGGYVSTKLFIPRDIWRVKGIKIKALDDKISQCDVLTSALQRLSKVDTLDADAVLEELQSFDTIMDTVRQTLAKKLGGDVGLTGSLAVMSKSPAVDDTEAGGSKSSASVKSLASSWRKLRSKSSAPALTPAQLAARKDATNNELAMQSLPMTNSSAVTTSRSYKAHRHPPPTPSSIPHIASMNAAYMYSLARLFDAVQVLDSIARQVEDPGLKATSKTQVGLELSIRGAAEFFSFYILRFALADIGMLIDKYLKRNGEWVMT